MYVFKSFFQKCITFLLTFYYMLLIGIPHVILAELANKTLRTAFSPFYLSSLVTIRPALYPWDSLSVV